MILDQSWIDPGPWAHGAHGPMGPMGPWAHGPMGTFHWQGHAVTLPVEPPPFCALTENPMFLYLLPATPEKGGVDWQGHAVTLPAEVP